MLARDGIQEKIVNLRVHDRRTDIITLQGLAVVLRGIVVSLVCHFDDEHLTSFGEEDGSLCGDHSYILVRFHDLLDTGQR